LLEAVITSCQPVGEGLTFASDVEAAAGSERVMRYRLLGKTGLRVSELCLGTMTFGEEWKFGASPEVSRAMFDAFCEAGGNFIDTANTYTFGTSERLVGEFIAAERDYFVVSSKYSLSTCARKIQTPAGTIARTCSRPSSTACDNSRPSSSTFTGCTPGIRSRRSKR
jgi:hypothetical protein